MDSLILFTITIWSFSGWILCLPSVSVSKESNVYYSDDIAQMIILLED